MPSGDDWSDFSPQGTTVSFGGVPIGYLKSFDSSVDAGSLEETTSVFSQVVGTGANARVVKEYDCLMIEPPKLSISFWGPPSFSPGDAGKKAQLEFQGASATISGEAILTGFTHAGRAGEYSEGTATFQLTGV